MDKKYLEKAYKKLISLEDTDDGIFDFRDLLLSDDEEETLLVHLTLLSHNEDLYLKNELFSFFTDRKDKEKVCNFLLQRYEEEKNLYVKADIIQLLGHLRCPESKNLAEKEISSPYEDIRYRCIIVLGWIGDIQTLPILNQFMEKDHSGKLRGYSATAMRQIWHNYPDVKNDIINMIINVIEKETNEDALIGMIVTLQDLYQKKFGLIESNYGDIEGDVTIAKDNFISFLNKNK